MSIAGIIVLVIMIAIVLSILFAPFFRRTTSKNIPLDRQRERAIAYYERVLTNVRDLDEYVATGKLSQQEYQQERELWAERGVKILRLFDELDQNRSLVEHADADDATIDATIEEAVRTMRLVKEG